MQINTNYKYHFQLLLIILLAVAGCKEEQVQEKAPLPPIVRTLRIEKGVKTETRSFPLFAKEGKTAKLSFRVAGQLLNFTPKIGQIFQKDEIIGSLDQRDYKLAISRIEHGLEEARAGLAAMKKGARKEDLAALESQLTGTRSQLEQAERQYQRMVNLRRDGTVSEVQYDLAKGTRDSLKAAKEALESQLEKAKAGARPEEIQMMEAKIAGLNVDLNLAKNALADTVLKAPFKGSVSEKFFDNHEMIAPGIPVLTLIDSESIEAALSVPQEIVLKKDQIQKIECKFDSIPGEKFPAAIKEIGNSVQQGNLAYPLTITIMIPKEKEGKLLAGMTGTAKIFLSVPRSAYQIPASAILPNNTEKESKVSSVWLVDPKTKTVKAREIKLGTFSEDGVVVESGLNDGDLIVVAGARFLSNGQKIRLEKQELK
ncbi:MAG: efflux RND transporter periplasmic adaptor subunit [Planctomycetia bacterium]|nr:efflux RND transporter periplasmic adaptor subunit [Planctomycetia bacterium]